MSKHDYEKPLIEVYLRPKDEEDDVLDFLGRSPNAGGYDGDGDGYGGGNIT